MKFGLDAYAVPTIRDDAGVQREVFNPYARGETDPEVLDLARRIVQHDQATHSSPLSKADLPTILPAFLIPLTVMTLAPWAGVMAAGPVGMVLVMLPMMGVLFLVMRRRLRRRTAESTRQTLLGSGRCPACAYAVFAITPGPEGLIRCPECDASWRPDRFPAQPALPEPTDAATARESAPSRWFAAPLLHDARGTVRALGEFRRVPELADAAKEIARVTRVRRFWTSVGWALLFTPVIGTQLYSLRWGPIGGARLGAILSYAPLAGLVFFVGLAFLRIRASWTGRTIRGAAAAAEVLLRRGRCPSCLSPTADPPAVPAGAPTANFPIECPRCHALWTRPYGPRPNPATP